MGIPLISEIQAYNNGNFALVDDNAIRGGFRIVNNLTERNAISEDKRKHGMRVFVISTDYVYVLQEDLITWLVDTLSSQALQSAYNGGAQIVTKENEPVSIQGVNDSRIFQVKDSGGNDILSINGKQEIEFFKTLKGKEYTTNIVCVAPSYSPDLVIDLTDISEYRAVQYFYTISNSDDSGHETGQIFLVHNGHSVVICSMMNSSIGLPCNVTFAANVDGQNQMCLLVAMDNSPYARILHLFKVALS